jgi:hypothetical protein
MKTDRNIKSNPFKNLVLSVVDNYLYYVVIKKSYKQQLEQNISLSQPQNANFRVAL